jgi:hypothetical protein
MLSRVSIDVDEKNNPLIVLAVETKSDDLRDKIANRFTVEFDKGSRLCEIEHTGLDRNNRMVWEIKPVKVEEKYLTPKEVIKLVHLLKKDPDLQKVPTEDLVKKYL